MNKTSRFSVFCFVLFLFLIYGEGVTMAPSFRFGVFSPIRKEYSGTSPKIGLLYFYLILFFISICYFYFYFVFWTVHCEFCLTVLFDIFILFFVLNKCTDLCL